MGELTALLEHPIFGVGAVVLFVFLLMRSSVFYWVIKIVVLLLWGLATVGATIFVVVAIHIPKEHYLAAVLTLVFGGFISLFWVFFGLPALVRSFRPDRSGRRPWQ